MLWNRLVGCWPVMGLLSRAPPRRRKDQSAYCLLLTPCITSAQPCCKKSKVPSMVLLWGTIRPLNGYCLLLRTCITPAQPPHKNSKVTTSKQKYHACYYYEDWSAHFKQQYYQLLSLCITSAQGPNKNSKYLKISKDMTLQQVQKSTFMRNHQATEWVLPEY